MIHDAELNAKRRFDFERNRYDPRTLFIPKSAWQKFTNFEKQYWEIKRE